MGDGYTARFSRRWRIVAAVGAVVVSAPLLTPAPLVVAGAAGRAAAALLVLAQAAGFWWLEVRPRLGTAVVLAAAAGLQVLYPGLGPGLAFVVLCTYAWLRPAAETLWGLGLAALAACGPAVARGRWAMAGLWLGGVVLAWSWGALVRARGARRLAERRQAVLEERARIARELHDVLSHTVSVMVVQAAAADDVFDADPARAREALRRTEQAGRQALAELRWFLRTVRADEGDAGTQAPPQPGLGDVERLAETVSAAGLPVTVRREDDDDADVPLAVQLSAYRIVQEALTNALRHAGAGKAEVVIRSGPSEVYVEVRDDGRGGSGTGSGQGIPGMRERAALLGGTLRTGPAPGGGFEVAAWLPTRERAQ
ncbi:histidine kinase [Dactylosporangium fulvum]|uniref:histidine kinase n=1 Tax=Dactylosporangium fulvum TaxID=53359 RepID=A0ABY5VWX2_9ACTN|nr:histidine kinase [Dactylosporangium fulvum]UWP80291.1 histidine kinase [Dactylosporangium fulvum]